MRVPAPSAAKGSSASATNARHATTDPENHRNPPRWACPVRGTGCRCRIVAGVRLEPQRRRASAGRRRIYVKAQVQNRPVARRCLHQVPAMNLLTLQWPGQVALSRVESFRASPTRLRLAHPEHGGVSLTRGRASCSSRGGGPARRTALEDAAWPRVRARPSPRRPTPWVPGRASQGRVRAPRPCLPVMRTYVRGAPG